MEEKTCKHVGHEKKMLLIVDPQIDFITGSLPVPDAVEAMDALAKYVEENGQHYGIIIVTCDHHWLDDSSFKDQGGPWPPHCIQSSVGAAVWPALMEQLPQFASKVVILYKGTDLYADEYSIYRSADGAPGMHALMGRGPVTDVDICGLAGDVCVKTTLEDSMKLYPRVRHRILTEFTASLDGGVYIHSMAKKLNEKNSFSCP